jgi:hypothetical protein
MESTMPKQLQPPKDYIYNLPKDYTLPDQFRAKIDEIVLQQGLSNKEAQAWVDLHVEITEDFVARLMQSSDDTVQPADILKTVN